MYLVGVDSFPSAAGSFLVDKFYQIPSSISQTEAFVKALENIVFREAIEVILPCGNEDCLTIAHSKEIFETKRCKVALSSHRVLLKSFDKGSAYEILRNHNIGAPEFYYVRTYDEFLSASRKLGYPTQPVVLKPRMNRGGRGVMILHPEIDFEQLLNNKPDINYSYDFIAGLLMKLKKFPEVILMEYLPGEFYSVDLLVKDGKPLVTVPKIRLWGTPSQTLRGIVDLNPLVIQVAEKACSAFGFDYNVNLEIKFSKRGNPVIYDLNPRLASSTAFCKAAGANLPYLAIKLALGEEFEIPKVRDRVMMIRSFKEIYLNNGQA